MAHTSQPAMMYSTLHVKQIADYSGCGLLLCSCLGEAREVQNLTRN